MRIFGWSTKGMILWGLFLVILGALILLRNYGALNFPFQFSRDWPMILIAWGLLKILDAVTENVSFSSIFNSRTRIKKKAYEQIISDLEKGKISTEEAIRELKDLNYL